MTSLLVAGVVAGYGVALPFGAVSTYLVGVGSRPGLRTAAAAAMGVATTDGLFAVIATIGGVGLRTVLGPIQTPLAVIAAVVLCGLAVRTLVTAVRRFRANTAVNRVAVEAHAAWRAYLGLIALTAVNPTTLAYFVSLVLGGEKTLNTQSFWSAVVFAIGVFVASASWQILLAGGGMMFRRVLSAPRSQLVFASASSLIMIILAGRVLIP